MPTPSGLSPIAYQRQQKAACASFNVCVPANFFDHKDKHLFLFRERCMSTTVLVVDDSATIRQQVGLALSVAGLDIVEAVDGVEGLKKIRAGRNQLRHLRREHAEQERYRDGGRYQEGCRVCQPADHHADNRRSKGPNRSRQSSWS